MEAVLQLNIEDDRAIMTPVIDKLRAVITHSLGRRVSSRDAMEVIFTIDSHNRRHADVQSDTVHAASKAAEARRVRVAPALL